MTHAEQHSMILEVGEYSHKMNRKDFDAFEVMRQRDKDDEDLDFIARKRLVELHELYVKRRGAK
jgi:hypothetical protein